jgi:hypothetical protein
MIRGIVFVRESVPAKIKVMSKSSSALAPPRENESVKRKIIRALKISLGIFLLLLGLLLGLVPVLQGWVLGIIGLVILYQEVAWVRRMVHRLEEKFPRFARAHDRAARRLHQCRERRRAGESWRKALACCFGKSKPEEAPQQEGSGHGDDNNNAQTQPR